MDNASDNSEERWEADRGPAKLREGLSAIYGGGPATNLAREGVEDLRVVVSGLPATHREVLLRRYVDEMSLEEISRGLSIPLGTVKSRIHNGLKMLAEDPKTRRFFE